MTYIIREGDPILDPKGDRVVAYAAQDIGVSGEYLHVHLQMPYGNFHPSADEPVSATYGNLTLSPLFDRAGIRVHILWSYPEGFKEEWLYERGHRFFRHPEGGTHPAQKEAKTVEEFLKTRVSSVVDRRERDYLAGWSHEMLRR
jgi:hypothetical protein